ncbi:hypothetical protein P3L51_03550 [Streptomyces sp. PSRA5]|uniref:hypothetical protein n=1 Tax=Streptomyces panacea TaxID=3035064 RepID=UPI00339BE8F3
MTNTTEAGARTVRSDGLTPTALPRDGFLAAPGPERRETEPDHAPHNVVESVGPPPGRSHWSGRSTAVVAVVT